VDYIIHLIETYSKQPHRPAPREPTATREPPAPCEPPHPPESHRRVTHQGATHVAAERQLCPANKNIRYVK
jgi:hypothetical protein